MEKIKWKVDGMHCANCALTINHYLEKKGATNITVNPIDGFVHFDLNTETASVKKGVEALGYSVKDKAGAPERAKGFLYDNTRRLLFCLPFSLVLMAHMLPGVHHFLMEPWLQLALCLPVFAVGMWHFGRSAVKSLRNGLPNMNVLITVGSLAAFIYSLYGTLFHLGPAYQYYETTATIITLVFFGNYLEDASVKSTQRALDSLAKSQKVTANMIAFDDQHQEQVFPVDSGQLRNGDLILIRTGEQVPADAKVLWGEAQISEALLTGESVPVFKQKKDQIIAGSIVEEGTLKAQVTAAGSDTVLSGIHAMVQKAQGEKPPMQQLADRISAIFVPVVLVIAVLTFLVNWIVLQNFTPAMLRSIAVLVIACPCAMGLATPAAIAVGLGRAARNGILFRHAKSMELFTSIKQVVFDKTGTLTTGKFTIGQWQVTDSSVSENEFKQILVSLERHSNHPMAQSLVAAWNLPQTARWKSVEEVKGLGVKASDAEGDHYVAGSYKILPHNNQSTAGVFHNIYLTKNNKLIGWVDMADELRPEAKAVVGQLHRSNIKTILLSGDQKSRTEQLASQVGIDEVYAEQSPADKLQKIEDLDRAMPTVMVGDGINDAPALAKATIGVSLSDASQLAVQSAQVVLMNNHLKKLPMALGLGKHTFITIKQNLYWAFAYNLVAIPVAAFGLLGVYGPIYGALIMGLSDVVLGLNSVRLFVKKVA